ncbi:hypothetical protein Smp_152430 [Schistosoma mansoni]|uniref:hypothetical protein n=1 Tax=Schistosoma mansoni TaxID=6183 RepID=UPI0001A630B4|nr:hypothetical protein Smp_152430 [Schistosoma mansoni]|eukprot:XP_018646284.1 hypothetical protein Smp_152430 [Schistosoma mansoni]
MEPNNINVKPEPLFSNLSTGVVYPLSIHDPGNNQLSPSCTVLQDDSFTNSNSIRKLSVGFALNDSDKLDTSTTVCLSSQTKAEFYPESDKSNHNSFSSSTDSNTKPLSVHCAEDSSNVFSAQSSLPSLSSEFQVPNLPNECSHKLPVHAAAKPSEALFVRALIGRCKRIAPLWFRGVSSMRERNREENRRMACNSGQSQSDWSLIALKIGEMNAGSETDAVSNLLKKLYKELPSDSVFWFLKCWLGSEDTLNDPHSCVISRGDAKGRMRRIDGGKGSDKVWRLDTIVGMLYHGLPMSSTDTNIMVHTCDHELCVRPQHIRFRASSVALVVVLKALAQAGYTIIPPSIAANSEGIAPNVPDEYVDVFGPFSIEQLQQYRSENLNPANESISKLTLSASDRDLIDLVPVIKDALQKSETSMTITTGSMNLNRANSFPNSYLSYDYNGGIHHFKSERSNLKRPRPISPSSFPSSPAKNSYHHYYSSSIHPQIRRPSDSTLLTNGNISSLISNNSVSNNTSSAFYTFSTHDNSALSRSLQCVQRQHQEGEEEDDDDGDDDHSTSPFLLQSCTTMQQQQQRHCNLNKDSTFLCSQPYLGLIVNDGSMNVSWMNSSNYSSSGKSTPRQPAKKRPEARTPTIDGSLDGENLLSYPLSNSLTSTVSTMTTSTTTGLCNFDDSHTHLSTTSITSTESTTNTFMVHHKSPFDLLNSDEIGSTSPNGRRVIAAIVAALANVSESPLMMESSTPVNNSRRSVSACSLPHFDGNTFNEDSIDLFSHPNYHHQNPNNHNNGNFITNIHPNPTGQSIKNHSLNGGNNEWNTSNKLMTKKSLRLGIGDEQPLTPPPPKLMSSTSSSSSSSKKLTPLSGSLIKTITTTSTSFTDDHTTLDIIPKLSPNVNCTMNDDDDNNNMNNIDEYNLNRKNSSPQESSMQELASLLRNSPASGISQELIDMLANMAQQYGMQQSRTGSRASRPSSQVAQRFYRSLVNGSVCGSPFPITPVGSSSSSTFNFLHTPNSCGGVSGVSVGGIVTCEQNNNITPLSYCHQTNGLTTTTDNNSSNYSMLPTNHLHSLSFTPLSIDDLDSSSSLQILPTCTNHELLLTNNLCGQKHHHDVDDDDIEKEGRITM